MSLRAEQAQTLWGPLWDDDDHYGTDRSLSNALGWLDSRIPARFRTAEPDNPGVQDWITGVIAAAKVETTTILPDGMDPKEEFAWANAKRVTRPSIAGGASLLLLGVTGTGKTHQAFGLLRSLTRLGLAYKAQHVTEADLYAGMRPRPGGDSEGFYEGFANASLLLLDDIGAAKTTEWTEEVTYRLINHRYEHMLPTVITSNAAPRALGESVGERVASRLTEMCTRVVLTGGDRRRA